jgi:hypothetical protein
VDVREELKRVQPDIMAKGGWAKKNGSQIFVPADDMVQAALQQVMSAFPRLVGLGGRSAADPWVIALAMANGWTVVTEEKATGKADKPKIPDVCAGLGVKVMKGADLIEVEGWVI